MSKRIATFIHNKCILEVDHDISRICSINDVLRSPVFLRVVQRFVAFLKRENSYLLDIFNDGQNKTISSVIANLQILATGPIPERLSPSASLLFDFMEELYTFWLSLERFLVLHSKNHYSQESKTVLKANMRHLEKMVIETYRLIQKNITCENLRIERETNAGIQVGLVTKNQKWLIPDRPYMMLGSIPMIRRIVLKPPLILNPPTNKRFGRNQEVLTNPLEGLEINSNEWLCYPAKVGPLTILVFFHPVFMELGCSLINLFDLASYQDIKKKPDAIVLFGVPDNHLEEKYSILPTVYYHDQENDIFVGAVSAHLQFGYFGFLKKMVLTLHNLIMIKRNRLPFHGMMAQITLSNNRKVNLLVIGDTGTGKSETLEALRQVDKRMIRRLTIIADDMGSIEIDKHSGKLRGYGTETGAFVRLNDMRPEYAFGQMNRAIIISPQEVNARLLIPVTTLTHVIAGYEIDYLLYANNYSLVDYEQTIIERLSNPDDALFVFARGSAMSKGTTTSVGITHVYFANPFGAIQERARHQAIAKQVFETAFATGVFVGELRTRLGIAGLEQTGPEAAAKALLELFYQEEIVTEK
ncbi:MAG: phosphoenolpyruvate carboxykinase [Candidatus Falkowbacteria bacterium]|nr:phosphoenolpyruvate carboxykinase [Candidatus Falkowbacteria bacterium]